MDISTIKSFDLIRELESRGYMTNLLFCREDVDTQLVYINENRIDDGETPVEFDDFEKDSILGTIDVEMFIERYNGEIIQEIHNSINAGRNL